MGGMTGIIRKMMEKSTCELAHEASYYNYSGLGLRSSVV